MKENAIFAESIRTNTQETKSSGELRKKLMAAGAAGALVLGLSACGPGEENVGAMSEPSPQSTEVVIETPESTEPTPDPIETPEASTPTTPEYAMTSVVNYDLFTDFESLDMIEKTKRCDQFFIDNGVLESMEGLGELGSAQDIVDEFEAKLNAIWDVNADTSNPENQKVAASLLECITASKSGVEEQHNARSFYTSELEYVLENGDTRPPYDFGEVTKQAQGAWSTQEGMYFVIETNATDFAGDSVPLQLLIKQSDNTERSMSRDWRLVGLVPISAGVNVAPDNPKPMIDPRPDQLWGTGR